MNGEWSERLSKPDTRQVCRVCQTRESNNGCPLCDEIKTTPIKVYCLPVDNGKKELGLASFYFFSPAIVDPKKKDLLNSFACLSATFLEARKGYLRQRDIFTLQNLTGIRNSFEKHLGDVSRKIKKQFSFQSVSFLVPRPEGVALISSNEDSESKNEAAANLLWDTYRDTTKAILGSVNLDLESGEAQMAACIIPVTLEGDNPLGVMLCTHDLTPEDIARDLPILVLLADDLAVVFNQFQNVEQIAYSVAMEERFRLAREIHDGLVQTLAFLKIQSSQMLNELNLRKLDSLERTLTANYRTISSAYRDARDEIDNLRIVPESSTKDLLTGVAREFNKDTGIEVNYSELAGDVELPLSVQAQLIRIVQEAFTNIRKHAGAGKVELKSRIHNGEVVFEITDDGRGFESGQVDPESKYGLVGMRERTDMVGGDFQIVSMPEKGTTVRISIPVAVSKNRI